MTLTCSSYHLLFIAKSIMSVTIWCSCQQQARRGFLERWEQRRGELQGSEKQSGKEGASGRQTPRTAALEIKGLGMVDLGPLMKVLEVFKRKGRMR